LRRGTKAIASIWMRTGTKGRTEARIKVRMRIRVKTRIEAEWVPSI
jgi:hypothetical protein